MLDPRSKSYNLFLAARSLTWMEQLPSHDGVCSIIGLLRYCLQCISGYLLTALFFSKSMILLGSCGRTSTRSRNVVNDLTPSKIRPTISLYQLKVSAAVQTEFASKCGGRVCTPSQDSFILTNSLEDMKMRMCLIGGVIILLIVIIVPTGM